MTNEWGSVRVYSGIYTVFHGAQALIFPGVAKVSMSSASNISDVHVFRASNGPHSRFVARSALPSRVTRMIQPYWLLSGLAECVIAKSDSCNKITLLELLPL